MSSALVRQALAFVDDEDCGRNKRGAVVTRSGGKRQDKPHPYKQKNKKNKPQTKSEEDIAEENIKKLLALSKPTSDSKITEKIVQRAVKGKPLLEKVEIKKEEYKSIFFPDEPEEDEEGDLSS